MIKTVLIVDDSPTMRMLLRVQVRAIPNIRIIEARSVDDALMAKDLETPTVIITDVNMPNRTGFDLVEEIRSKQGDRLTGIIIVTTRGATEDQMRGLRLGANAYVTKPVDSTLLVDAITRLLG